jgi:hypothetical protein
VVVNLIGKQCAHCQNEFPMSQFYRKAKGWHADCKTCISAKMKSKYLSKKKIQDDRFKNIIIKPIRSKILLSKEDVISALELFLIEEFKHEQNV